MRRFLFEADFYWKFAVFLPAQPHQRGCEIATRARVLKRELYALVGNKQEMLIACISERAKRFDVPADLHVLHDREILAQVLASFGTKLVREISDPIEDHRFMKCRCDISH